MSFLSDLIQMAEDALPLAQSSGVVGDVIAVAEAAAPPQVTMAISTAKAFLATPLGGEIETAFGSFITHLMSGSGGSLFAVPAATVSAKGAVAVTKVTK